MQYADTAIFWQISYIFLPVLSGYSLDPLLFQSWITGKPTVTTQVYKLNIYIYTLLSHNKNNVKSFHLLITISGVEIRKYVQMKIKTLANQNFMKYFKLEKHELKHTQKIANARRFPRVGACTLLCYTFL